MPSIWNVFVKFRWHDEKFTSAMLYYANSFASCIFLCLTLHLFHAKFLFPYEPLCFVWVDKIASSFITKTVRRKFFIMSTEFDKKISDWAMTALITKMALVFSWDFFDVYFWPFNKSHEKINAIFVISATKASIWNVFIKFRWHDEKFTIDAWALLQQM